MDDNAKILAGTFFSDRPEASAMPLGFPVVRAPQKGSDIYTLLSDEVIGCWTHFFRGRTQPCLGDLCTICSPEVRRTWHGWLLGYDPSRRQTYIVELPAGPAMALTKWREERGSLRGCSIELRRKNGKVNGPVQVGTAGPKIDLSLLPPCLDLKPMLLRMWQIRGCDSVVAIEDNVRVYPEEDEVYNREQA